ncbi:hypothetical protein BH23THE1_BH23THE1_18120 [soil metagenome]
MDVSDEGKDFILQIWCGINCTERKRPHSKISIKISDWTLTNNEFLEKVVFIKVMSLGPIMYEMSQPMEKCNKIFISNQDQFSRTTVIELEWNM